MARSTQRKTASPQVANGKNRKTPTLPAPQPAATTEGLNDPGAQVTRVSDHHEIAMRAFEIYLSRGESPGRDLEDWLEAERQLQGR